MARIIAIILFWGLSSVILLRVDDGVGTVNISLKEEQIKNSRQEPTTKQQAIERWKDLSSYLRAEAKFWDFENYTGKEVLINGIFLG
jgi:hypothetical protein